MKRGSREDWTDPVLMPSVRPLSAQEIYFNAEQSHANQAQ